MTKHFYLPTYLPTYIFAVVLDLNIPPTNWGGIQGFTPWLLQPTYIPSIEVSSIIHLPTAHPSIPTYLPTYLGLGSLGLPTLPLYLLWDTGGRGGGRTVVCDDDDDDDGCFLDSMGMG